MSNSLLPDGYQDFIEGLKARIAQERLRVVLSANTAFILLYWDVGLSILQRQREQGWGAKVIERISADLKRAFPDMKGLSPRNLRYMRAFADAWPDRAIVQQAVAQLPWGQNVALLERLDDQETRLWYARKAAVEGWSRPILELQIERRLYEREGKAITNFPATLPPADSDLATQVFKDPYLFDFLGTADLRRERELEQALLDHVQRFLLELGAGFAFVGRQVRLVVGEDELFPDLLFYHLRLRAFVVIELKAAPFDAAFTGQLNLYLSVVDAQLRHPSDNPTIGLLLVKDPKKKKLLIEYSLQGIQRPMGVASWETQLTRALPDDLRGSLPTIEELEKELEESDL